MQRPVLYGGAGGTDLESLVAYLTSVSGYLWADDPDKRDPAAGGLNPNWLKNNRDVTATGWTTSADLSVTSGLSDPDGGTAAQRLTADDASGAEQAEQSTQATEQIKTANQNTKN